MKKTIFASALVAAGLFAASAQAHDFDRHNVMSMQPVTLAVFGDWPYNDNLLQNAPLLINSVNSDSAVSMVVHLGDIHSGSMACTGAGYLPPLPSSNPGWNQEVFYRFQQFNKPLVYTPGDNEWTDCHKSKEHSSGAPMQELASIRSLFFSQPGKTLGRQASVLSQAQYYDHHYPADAQYVENMMWMEHHVVFVTVNVPGSNNDTKPWTGDFADPTTQDQEVAERTAANTHWLQAAFRLAKATHARAVVIGMQADMWDPEAQASDALYNYTPFVQSIADLTTDFARPVLLLNGDSHVYEADHPLADPNSAQGLIHHTQAVPNLTRITVQGSTNAPAEWLRLTIDPRKSGNDMFSWQNVPYCADPKGSCQ